MFAQLVAPLMTEITCLRSHGLTLFHLVSAMSALCRGDYGLAGEEDDQVLGTAGPGLADTEGAGRVHLQAN